VKNFEIRQACSIEQALAFLNKGRRTSFSWAGGRTSWEKSRKGSSPRRPSSIESHPRPGRHQERKGRPGHRRGRLHRGRGRERRHRRALPGPPPGRRRHLFSPIADHGHGRRQSLPAAALLVLPGCLLLLCQAKKADRNATREGAEQSIMRFSPADSAGRSIRPTLAPALVALRRSNCPPGGRGRTHPARGPFFTPPRCQRP